MIGQTCTVVNYQSGVNEDMAHAAVKALDALSMRFNAPARAHSTCTEEEDVEVQEAPSLIHDFTNTETTYSGVSPTDS